MIILQKHLDLTQIHESFLKFVKDIFFNRISGGIFNFLMCPSIFVFDYLKTISLTYTELEIQPTIIFEMCNFSLVLL